MAIYTYVRNASAGERTSRIILRGGDLVVNINEYADFTADEYAALSSRLVLVPGIVPGTRPAGVGSLPGLYDILSHTAVDELLDLVDSGLMTATLGNVTALFNFSASAAS